MAGNESGIGPLDSNKLYQTYKPLLFSIAYRLLGSVEDAEDVVQEMFIMIHKAPVEQISNVKAYLCKMVTNRCLNLLKSAQKRRETYLGPWLPEPLLTDKDQLPLHVAERDETITYAFLVMLDTLSPIQRVIFVLREAFEYDYKEIANMVGKSETNCRKIYSRSREKMGISPSHALLDYPLPEEQLVQRFVAAFKKGSVQELSDLLSEKVVFTTDGGGRVRAAIQPIVGRSRVLTLLSSKKAFKEYRASSMRITTINGRKGILFCQDGIVKGVICFDWLYDMKHIKQVYMLINPDKLKHIGRAE